MKLDGGVVSAVVCVASDRYQYLSEPCIWRKKNMGHLVPALDTIGY